MESSGEIAILPSDCRLAPVGGAPRLLCCLGDTCILTVRLVVGTFISAGRASLRWVELLGSVSQRVTQRDIFLLFNSFLSSHKQSSWDCFISSCPTGVRVHYGIFTCKVVLIGLFGLRSLEYPGLYTKKGGQRFVTKGFCCLAVPSLFI